jgi:hypothetical protein
VVHQSDGFSLDAPNNGIKIPSYIKIGPSKSDQCAGQALKQNRISLGLDAAGFIPGEELASAGIQYGIATASSDCRIGINARKRFSSFWWF